MPQVKSDVETINDGHLEGDLVAVIAAFAVEHGQAMQYLQAHGVPSAVLMTVLGVLIRRVYVYVRAGRTIAQTRLQTKMQQMALDAEEQAKVVAARQAQTPAAAPQLHNPFRH